MRPDPADEESVAVGWSRLYASLYYFLGRAMVEAFGSAGEGALRRAVHDYGAYRAGCVRADHQARGLALNLANMMNFGDMPNTDSLERTDRVCTPSYFRVTVTECTLYDAWKDLGGLDVGRIYCEEVHHPLYCGYVDGVTLDLPDFLTKGDEVCTFVLAQPDAPEPAAEPTPEPCPEIKVARLYGVLYCFLAGAMRDAFGSEGEQVLRCALGEYARHEADRQSVEGYRPYILMMNSRAKAHLALEDGDLDRALAEVNSGLEKIRKFFTDHDQPQLIQKSNEVQALLKLREELLSHKPQSPLDVLQQRLTTAVESEDYEQAARLRDEIRRQQEAENQTEHPSPETT